MDLTNVEITWLKEFLIPQLLKNGKLKNSENFMIKNISIKFIGSDEAFMLTTCYRTTIIYQWNDEECSETLVIKKTPKISQDDYDAINFNTLFHNEITAYADILPALSSSVLSTSTSSTSTESSLSSTIPMQRFPQHFYSHCNETEACIVLRDFNIDGWRMTKSRVNLSLEHVFLAVKNLANFHATCYAVKHKEPEHFKKLINSLGESRYAKEPPHQWALVLQSSGQRSINAAKEFFSNQISQEFYENLEKILPETFSYGKKRVRPNEPIATICHGDYLRNNIAYRYDTTKDPEIPTDVIMFDFQTLRYSSPMIDLVSFMSLSVGKEIRQQNFYNIFKCYWNELVNTYQQRGFNTIPDFLSYDNFLKEYIMYLPYGLGIASCFLMTLHEPNNMSAEELLNIVQTDDEIIDDVNTRGGKIVDAELASLVYELYEFTIKYNVDVFKGFV